MRIFGVAALLSVCVLIGCAAWYHGVTSGNGPDHSVDLRPLVPILAAVAALALIWLVAGIAWISTLAARHRKAGRDQR
jgi:amino acid transporter